VIVWETALKPSINYVQGYGWHVGRLLVYPVLCAYSVFSVFLWMPFETLIGWISGLPLPYGLVSPILLGVWLRRRLKRKRNGEPIVVVPLPFFERDANYPVEMIRREQDPMRFNRFYRMDLLAWAGAITIHTVLLLSWRLK
jgi:hypothetical protein